MQSSTRISYDSSGRINNQLLQEGQSWFQRNSIQAGFGIEWGINKRNNLSAGLGYHHLGNNSSGFLNQQQTFFNDTGNIAPELFSVINSGNHSNSSSFDWHVTYRELFVKDGHELTVSFQLANGRNDTYFQRTGQGVTGDSLLDGSHSSNTGNDHKTSLQADDVRRLKSTLDRLDYIKSRQLRFQSLVNDMPLCMVHGDITGKNIRINPEGKCWVID